MNLRARVRRLESRPGVHDITAEDHAYRTDPGIRDLKDRLSARVRAYAEERGWWPGSPFAIASALLYDEETRSTSRMLDTAMVEWARRSGQELDYRPLEELAQRTFVILEEWGAADRWR